MDNLVSGTTKQKELSLQKIIKLNIPLPPLKEQERIVAKIEMIRESIKRIDF
ncbi:TPA: restriction endonuclease subunit S [Enterococcus faecium]|nr:restriction endonuclease subunit S [Enterococcus faecium]